MRNLLEHDWNAVTGACLMIERGKFEAAGGFDERFLVAYNDVELCFRLVKRGLFNVVCPAVELAHHESLTRGHDNGSAAKRARLEADKKRIYNAHPEFLAHDPFHNPSLHPDDVQLSVAA